MGKKWLSKARGNIGAARDSVSSSGSTESGESYSDESRSPTPTPTPEPVHSTKSARKIPEPEQRIFAVPDFATAAEKEVDAFLAASDRNMRFTKREYVFNC